MSFVIDLPETDIFEACSYHMQADAALEERWRRATFIGRGASSAVWKTEDGHVLKLTADPAVLQWALWSQSRPHRSQPATRAVHSVSVRPAAWNSGDPERWYCIEQPFLQPLANHEWEAITTTASRVGRTKDSCGWARCPSGLMARGTRAKHFLKILQQELSSPQEICVQAACAIGLLSQWWSQVQHNAGLDIDRQTNWAKDSHGTLVLLDPVHEGAPQSTTHWSCEF